MGKNTENKSPNKAKLSQHFLCGCRFDILWRILWENRFDFKISSWPQVLAALGLSLVLLPVAAIEKAVYKKRIEAAEPKEAPVFILGHWRSGTTYLMNLMALDPQFSFFDMASTFTFPVFLTMRRPIEFLYKSLFTGHRPMDNMTWDLHSAQEEVMALGTINPDAVTHMMAFPFHVDAYTETALMEDQPEPRQTRWKESYEYLIKKLNFANPGKRPLTKSPDNTAKVQLLREIYPDAKFIHIYRDPYRVVNSTIHMFNTLFAQYSLQGLPCEDMKEYVESKVVNLYKGLYNSYFRDMEEIPPENLIEVRYEDFVKDPVSYLEKCYAHLNIRNFEAVRSTLEEYVRGQKDYQVNKLKMDQELRERINRDLKFFFDRYGYEMEA